MRVFIANFGQKNYLWPECLRRNTIGIYNNKSLHPFWVSGDRQGYIEYVLAHVKTERMQVPTRALASRWYGLNDAIANTSGDYWVHREKDELWWTISRPDPVEITLAPSDNPTRDGPQVYELHKPCKPWSNRTQVGTHLSWGGLHPRAKDFLFTEGTLQELSPDNADYALVLLAGDELEPWHNQPKWRDKVERTKKNPVVTYDARKKTIWRMVETAFNTAANSNGQQVLRTVKDKRSSFDRPSFEAYVSTLIDDQDGLCAITGIALQFDGEEDDPELRCSLDRIDSNGHYEPGNLQVVCKFVNRWKSDGIDTEFRRLIQLVRSTQF